MWSTTSCDPTPTYCPIRTITWRELTNQCSWLTSNVLLLRGVELSLLAHKNNYRYTLYMWCLVTMVTCDRIWYLSYEMLQRILSDVVTIIRIIQCYFTNTPNILIIKLFVCSFEYFPILNCFPSKISLPWEVLVNNCTMFFITWIQLLNSYDGASIFQSGTNYNTSVH